MARYILIDTHKVEEGQMSEVRLQQLINDVYSGDGIILSKEETEAKFKEVFDAGFNRGEYLWIAFQTEEPKNLSWEEFKKQL